MADPFTMAIVATAFTVASAVSQGQQARREGEYNAAIAQRNAEIARQRKVSSRSSSIRRVELRHHSQNNSGSAVVDPPAEIVVRGPISIKGKLLVTGEQGMRRPQCIRRPAKWKFRQLSLSGRVEIGPYLDPVGVLKPQGNLVRSLCLPL